MLLHALDHGTGDRVAVLLHGLQGSAESWHRVIPLLVERGYRVITIDLPGHGLSPRDPALTIESAAASVVETARHLAPGASVEAMGHSYGATVLAAAAAELRPALAVYLDAYPAVGGGEDREALIARYAADRQRRMSATWLRETRPYYSEADAGIEARAAERFDPATAASVSCGADGSWLYEAGSILVHAEPSAWVTESDIRRLQDAGVHVRSIPGAAHTLWYSHFDEFTASLPELFGAR